jgi:hypothetical protein
MATTGRSSSRSGKANAARLLTPTTGTPDGGGNPFYRADADSQSGKGSRPSRDGNPIDIRDLAVPFLKDPVYHRQQVSGMGFAFRKEQPPQSDGRH